MIKDVKYPKKSQFTDKTSSVTSIVNCNIIYILDFEAYTMGEDRYSFRFIKVVNNEAWTTSLVQSQFRRSVLFNDIDFLKRKWDNFLRLK